MKPVLTSLVCCLAAAGLASRASADEADKADLAKRALAILDKNCAGCHGPNGKGEGHDAMDCILDVKKLIADEKHYIVPNDPGKSKVMKKIKEGVMPPAKDGDEVPITQRPSAADIVLLERWIQAGAPDTVDVAKAGPRSFISPDAMIDLMSADVNKMKREIDRRHTRYFVLTHLYNGGASDVQLDFYRAGLSKLVNSLSRKNPRIVVPKAIDPARTIFRIDLRDYSWNERTWDDILSQYPYSVLPKPVGATDASAAALDLQSSTGCTMPFLRADWFVFTASKPPLYENILNIPTSVQELEKQLGIDSNDDVEREKVARAAFNKSGVSNNNRVIERHEFGNGAYYRSGDFANNSDEEKKNLFSHPLDYVPDGGEIIFNLPNGMQAYMLVDKDGGRIERGPIKIVHDDTQPDKTVVNGISCMSCHDRGMKEKDDEVRAHVMANPTAFTKDETDKILALYPEKTEFQKLLDEDADRFKKAVEKAGAPLGKEEQVKVLASRFEKELDLPLAAGELGLTVEDFKKVLSDNSDLGKIFGFLNVNGGTVKREVWEAKFPDLVTAAGIGVLQGPLLAGSPADKLVEQARKALDDGDKPKALELFGKAADKDPKNLAAQQGRGDLLFGDEKYPEAIAAYNKAIELDGNDSVSIGNRGLARFRQGDNDAALPDLTKAIELQTLTPGVYAARGDIRLGAKDLTGAIGDYTEATVKDPLDAALASKLSSGLDERGLDFLDKEKYTDAIADFKKAREVSPKDVDVAFHLGVAHKRNGDAKEAIEDFAAVLELDDKNVTAYEQKADAEVGLLKYTEAIDDLRKALDVVPDDAILHAELGNVYLLNDDVETAIDETTTAIKKDPDFIGAYKIRAKAYEKRDKDGDADRAKDDFNKAEELEKAK